MNRRPNVISLLVLVPAIFLVLVVPVATRSGIPGFWKGFMLGSGAVLMIAAVALALLNRSSGNDPALGGTSSGRRDEP